MKRMSLRRLLIGGTLFFTVVPLLVVIGWFDYSGRESTRLLATDVLSNVADRLRADSESHLQRANDLMDGLADTSLFSSKGDVARTMMREPAKFESAAFSLTKQVDDLSYVYFGTSRGDFHGVEQVAGGVRVGELINGQSTGRRYFLAQTPGDRSVSLPSDAKAYEPRNRPWYTAAAEAKARVFTEVYASASKKTLLVTLAQPVYDEQQVLLGVFALDLPLGNIAEQLRRARISSRGVALILDEKGLLVGSSTGDDTYREGSKGLERVSPSQSASPTVRMVSDYLMSRTKTVVDTVATVERGVGRIDGDDGGMLFVQREFGTALGLKWRLVVAAPEVDFTADANERRRWALLAVAIMVLACSGLAYMFASRLSWRLQTLSTAAAAIGRGEVPPLPQSTRVAEVHQLSTVLHDSGESLRVARHQMAADASALQDAHDGLERRVSERTAELEKSREEALEAARAKAAFLATMSHEIRTPLNGVVGMSSLLAETQLDVEQRDFLSTIRLSSDQLLGVINDILDFSKIESGKLELEQEPLLLRHVVEEACDIAAPRAREKGLELLVDVPIGPEFPLAVKSDSTRIRQVLINFINNAVKFTERGEVAVQLRVLPGAVDADHARIEFRVRDTGIGIPAGRMDALFSAFMQVDASTTRKYGGTGLGLAICKRLAEAMGGQVGVSSQVGVGSEFWFTVDVPVCDAQVAATLNAVPDDAPVLTGCSVFVVDDNPTNLRILTRQLTNWGLLVRTFDSVSLALGALRSSPLPSAVVSDMHMPVVDGIEFARLVKADAKLKAVPLILLSSGVLPVNDPASHLFAARLLKPAREAQLFDALARCIDPARAATETPARAQTARRGQTVLVADDNLVNLKVAVSMLTKLGFDSVTALDGQLALDAALASKNSALPFSLVLMDLNMPNMDGLIASSEIRRLMGASAPPIIALTAAASPEDRERCLAAGMSDYLTKPLQLNALARALDHWIAAEPGDLNAIISVATNPIDTETKGSNDSKLSIQSPPGDAAMDFARLEEFREFDDDELSMTKGVIDVFLADGPSRVEAVIAAIASGDCSALSSAAHALKGAASNVGASGLQQQCSQLEHVAKAGELPSDGALQSAQLRALWAATETQLKKWLIR